MATFTWTTNPIPVDSFVTSTGLNTQFNYLAGFVAQTPTNVDPSQLGVYNAAFYGITTTSSNAQNTTALNNAFAAAGSGGTIFIPAIPGLSSITISGVITCNSGQFNNCNVYSATNANNILQTVGQDIFYLNNGSGSGTTNKGGQFFHDIKLKYNNGLTAGAAIHIENGQNTYIHRVCITDAPTGVFFDGTLSGDLEESLFAYQNNVHNIAAIHVGSTAGGNHPAQQIRISRTQVEFVTNGTGTSTGCLIDSVDTVALNDCYFYGAPTGITIGTSAVSGEPVSQVRIHNTQLGSSQTGIFIQSGLVSGNKISDVIIFGGQNQGGGSAGPTSVGVYIDTNGGTGDQAQDIKIIAHVIESFGLYGLQVNGGKNIQVIGGTFSSNGTAGVAITGVAADYSGFILISGTDLSASYEGGTAQTYAFLFTGTCGVPINIRNCPMLGYTGSPVSITGSPATLKIYDCPGYNDQNTVIATSISTVTSASAHGYYGPSRIAYSGGDGTTTYTLTPSSGLHAVTITAASGVIPMTSPYDTISFSGTAPSTLVWIGY